MGEREFLRHWRTAAGGMVALMRDRLLGLPGREVLPDAGPDFRGAVTVVEGGAGVADAPQICLKDEFDAYAWGPLGSGPAGPTGPTGPEGPQGPTGPTGPLSTVTVRAGNAASVSASSGGAASAACNAGEVATGGGCQVTGTKHYLRVSTQSGASGWTCNSYNATGSAQTLTAYVTCIA